MGLYGSVGAHVKTGKSPMAQDHFKTTLDTQNGRERTNNPKRIKPPLYNPLLYDILT